jgi:hypothetical protein
MESLLDNNAHDKMDEPFLFHILKMVKCRETRAIRNVQEQQGNTITRPRDILDTFITHFRQKYAPIERQHTCCQIEKCHTTQLSIKIRRPARTINHLQGNTLPSANRRPAQSAWNRRLQPGFLYRQL